MQNENTARLPTSQVRALAVDSETDPRTVEKYVSGERVLPMTAARIERALTRAGLQAVIAEVYARRRASSPPSPSGPPQAA